MSATVRIQTKRTNEGTNDRMNEGTNVVQPSTARGQATSSGTPTCLHILTHTATLISSIWKKTRGRTREINVLKTSEERPTKASQRCCCDCGVPSINRSIDLRSLTHSLTHTHSLTRPHSVRSSFVRSFVRLFVRTHYRSHSQTQTRFVCLCVYASIRFVLVVRVARRCVAYRSVVQFALYGCPHAAMCVRAERDSVV